jgi:hypothetical protein
MVNAFRPVDTRFAKPPDGFERRYFIKDSRTVRDVAGESMNVSTERFLNYGVDNSIVHSELGTCTHRHRDVVYSRGFEDRSALTLAHLASHLVDAPKLGLRLRQEEWLSLLRGLKVTEPRYVKPKGERTSIHSNHVLDVLTDAIPIFTETILGSFRMRLGNDANNLPMDPDIREFYLLIKERCPQLVDSLVQKLSTMKLEWTRFFTTQKSNDSAARDNSDCSPKKRQKRIVEESEDSVCVYLRLACLRLGSNYKRI